ncbi:MAG: hypothetical protein PHF21_01115 [Bacilli bacterium]|nr:hypothetical protein [Bacilli bacterium]
MLKGKEIILEIINNRLLAEQTESDIQQLSFDNTELNAFLASYNNPPEDIINLTENMFSNIMKNSELEDHKYMATIKYIQGLAILNKEKAEKILLSENQLESLDKLREVIKKLIDKNEYLIKHFKERDDKQIDDYRHVLKIIQEENIFSASDYDLVEKIIRQENSSEAENLLDKIFSFMNEFNSREFKKKKDKKNSPKEEDLEPKPTILTENVKKSESDFLINAPQTKVIEKNKEVNRTEKIKGIISFLSLDYENLSINLKLKLISLKNINELEELSYYIKEKRPGILHSFKKENIYGLVYLLTNSSINLIEEVTELLKTKCQIDITSQDFKRIINTLTIIFSKEGSQNFKMNLDIFSKYDISFQTLIRDNISLLTTDSKKLSSLIESLKSKEANIKDIFNKVPILLNKVDNNKINTVDSNLSILKTYGFDLSSLFTDDSIVMSILYSRDLSAKLDQFIEVGLNEFIHSDFKKAGSNFRTLIIKRIYYAYKNNYEVWFNPKNNHLDKDLNIEGGDFDIYQRTNCINDDKIEEIKLLYPIINLIDDGYRAAIYTDAPMGLLKRKTEFVFGTQIISRPKVFKIFKILMELKVDVKKALLYAIIYNSVLEPHEYDFIKEAVSRIGVDDNYDRLFKTI